MDRESMQEKEGWEEIYGVWSWTASKAELGQPAIDVGLNGGKEI